MLAVVDMQTAQDARTTRLRRSLGDLLLPGWSVQLLGWGMLTAALALPAVAWMFGWVRPPDEPAPELSKFPAQREGGDG